MLKICQTFTDPLKYIFIKLFAHKMTYIHYFISNVFLVFVFGDNFVRLGIVLYLNNQGGISKVYKIFVLII